jgi:hypothetical protein
VAALDLDYALLEIDAWVAEFGTVYGFDLTAQDKLGSVERTNNPRVHGSVRVLVPNSVNTEQYRDQELARSEDTIAVETEWRINASAQRLYEREAIRYAEQLRQHMTAGSWRFGREVHLTWLSTTRGPAAEDGAIYRVTQTYRALRDARLGG